MTYAHRILLEFVSSRKRLWENIASMINLYMPDSESLQPIEINEQAKVSSKEQVKRISEKQNKRNVDAKTKSKVDNGASVSAVTQRGQ